MNKYLLLYCGIADPSEGTKAEWIAWFASISANVIDSGNPLLPGRLVTADGADDLPAGPDAIKAYSLISAASMDDAQRIAAGAPHAASVQVYQSVPM